MLKDWMDKHKDTVLTIAFVAAIDHFLLGGALREKIKAMLEDILSRTKKSLGHDHAEGTKA